MNFTVSDRGKAPEAVALTEVEKLVAVVIRFSISNFIFKRFVVVDGCTENELPWELWITLGKIIACLALYQFAAFSVAQLKQCHDFRAINVVSRNNILSN